MSSRCLTFAVLLTVSCPLPRTWACYAVIVGREASADGSVLVGHNEQLSFGVRPVWTRFETRVFADQPSVETKALDLWNEAPDTAREYLSRYSAELAAEACREAERLLQAVGREH